MFRRVQEKSGGLQGSLNGIVGLECAFPILYTQLVAPGLVPLEVILRALCTRPREIFGLAGGALEPGAPADLAVLDLNRPHTIDASAFRSLGHATPFDGWGVGAAVALTLCGGEIVHHDLGNEEEL